MVQLGAMLGVGILESKINVYLPKSTLNSLLLRHSLQSIHQKHFIIQILSYVCTLCNNFLNDYTTKKIPRTAADKKKRGGGIR